MEKEVIEAKEVYKIHVVPHSHIDTEWYWTYGETKKRAVIIIEAVLSCMRKREDFTFAQDQVSILKPVLEYLDKEEREYLLRMVRQKRFEITGGMWVQPDTQIPHGEVLIRNILNGRKWFYDNLGVDVNIAWNIDTFGHCPQTPQILSKSGFKYFVFWRGVPGKIGRDLPNIFYWQSPDGSNVLTHWMNKSYVSPLNKLAPESINLKRNLFYSYRTASENKQIDLNKTIQEIKNWVNDLLEKSSQNITLIPFGHDNFIPQEDVFKAIDLLNEKSKGYNFVFSTPSKFFQEVKKENLRTFNYDFPLPLRALDLRGTFEGRCELKKAQRKVENALLSAEKFCAINFLFGGKYPLSGIKLAWDDVIFNSFHDIIGGSHTDDVYKEAMRKYGRTKETGRINETAEMILRDSLDELADKIKIEKEALIIFNSLSWQRNGLYEAKGSFNLRDEEGNFVPSQEKGNKTLFFVKDIPPLGYKAYYIDKMDLRITGTELKAKEDRLENKWYKIEFDKFCGGIKSIYDKEIKRELLDTSKYLGNELICQAHDGDLEGMLNLKENIWRMRDHKCYPPDIETGSVFASMKFKSGFEGGEREQTVSLYSDFKMIDFETKINLKKSGILLKVRFPLLLKNFKIYYETPYAVVERCRGHFAAQNWVSCQAGNYGVALINTGNPGYWIEENNLDLVLLWSVNQVRPPKSYNAPLARELGEHIFKYSLYPHQRSWQGAKIVQKGTEVNTPLMGMAKRRPQEGTLPSSKSLIKVKPDNFILSVLKKAEDDNDVVIRGYETQGKDSQVKIYFGFPVKEVWKTNLLEEKEERLGLINNMVLLSCKKFEIVTMRLRRDR